MKSWLKQNKIFNIFHNTIDDELTKSIARFKLEIKQLNPDNLEIAINDIYMIDGHVYCIYILYPKGWNFEDSVWDRRTKDVRYALTINNKIVRQKLYAVMDDLEKMICLQELNRAFNLGYVTKDLFFMETFTPVQDLIDDLSTFNKENKIDLISIK